MAASITVQNTIDYTKSYLNWANLTIGNNNEPAMSAANLTLQTITGPPFRWVWNRTTVSFLATEGIQDYNVFLPSFGFLETASVQLAGVITSVTITSNVAVFTANNAFVSLLGGFPGTTVTTSGCTTPALNGTFPLVSATPTSFTVAIIHGNLTESESGALALAGPIKPLEIKWGSLSAATEQDRPTFISVQDSDESGINFQFRVLPVPNAAYQIILSYQGSPPVVTNPSNTWQIPDQISYIYTYFFMFMMFDYFDDPRAGRYRQLAVAALLARQSGLSATDRNLFLGNWLPLMKEEESAQSEVQQGNQARGL
jgi:hypothetical protein